jgi:uncharacterized protein (TIGR03067 family)
VEKTLPPRPHLDHLRRQAKALLASLEANDPAAIATFREFLPAARGLSAEQVRSAGYRLADAQSAVARKSGFASWPELSRHVEQLRALEGAWSFASLEIDGQALPAAAMQASRLLIDGDRFRMESPEATYEGVFNINVEAKPHQIDVEFVEGPEAGNSNFGIFRLDGDQLELCLDVNGKPFPKEFRTSPGSGHAYETLRRATGARPEGVRGGTPGEHAPQARCDQPGASQIAAPDPSEFHYRASPTLTRLQGEWTAVKLVRDGMEFPPAMLGTGRRLAKDNEIKIHFGGQLIIDALVRINEGASPVEVDYLNRAGAASGSVQLGIMQWQGDVACFCMAAPGQPRPAEFTSAKASGRTLSHWRPKAAAASAPKAQSRG